MKTFLICILAACLAFAAGRVTKPPEIITKEVTRDVQFFDMAACNEFYAPYIEQWEKTAQTNYQKGYSEACK